MLPWSGTAPAAPPIDLVLVQAGGDVPQPYFVQTTEMTQGQYLALMGVNPSTHQECGLDCPVEMVTWVEAIEAVNALSRQAGLPMCYEPTACSESFGERVCSSARWLTASAADCSGYRLPSEAEWLHAAGAGSPGAPKITFTDGPDEDGCRRSPELDSISWYCRNSGGEPHPVGRKKPNPWGLYDTIGNVEEWAFDRSSPGGTKRVVLGDTAWFRPGGRWILEDDASPTSGNYMRGFRVVRTAPSPAKPTLSVPLKPTAPMAVDDTACDELQTCCDRIPDHEAPLKEACARLVHSGQQLGEYGVCRSSLPQYEPVCPGP